MKNEISCIIPFFNEEKRINKILSVITKVGEINQIICVDDGSTDKSVSIVKQFPQVKLISLDKNEGKSAAVATGLKKASEELILLLDADIEGITRQEISKAIAIVSNNEEVDMLLLRRSNAPREVKLSRSEIVITGERLLRKRDLSEILKTNPQGYQLETAINIYMIKNNKRVYWMNTSTGNVMKREKYGFWNGLFGEIKMHRSMLQFAGFSNYLKQFLLFGREQYKNL